jgi:hypothetical protein
MHDCDTCSASTLAVQIRTSSCGRCSGLDSHRDSIQTSLKAKRDALATFW